MRSPSKFRNNYFYSPTQKDFYLYSICIVFSEAPLISFFLNWFPTLRFLSNFCFHFNRRTGDICNYVKSYQFPLWLSSISDKWSQLLSRVPTSRFSSVHSKTIPKSVHLKFFIFFFQHFFETHCFGIFVSTYYILYPNFIVGWLIPLHCLS